MYQLIQKRCNFVAENQDHFRLIKKESIMKKVLFAVVAMIAIGFAACTNKAQAPAEAEGVDVEAAVSEITSALSEQIEAQDAGKFQEVLTAVQEKIKEFVGNNPEVAKEYVAKVQEFLKENAEKIKAFAGENEAVNNIINGLTAVPAEAVVSSLSAAVGAAGDAIEDAAEDAADAAAEKAEEVKDAAKEQAGEAVDAAADKAKEAMGL